MWRIVFLTRFMYWFLLAYFTHRLIELKSSSYLVYITFFALIICLLHESCLTLLNVSPFIFSSLCIYTYNGDLFLSRQGFSSSSVVKWLKNLNIYCTLDLPRFPFRSLVCADHLRTRSQSLLFIRQLSVSYGFSDCLYKELWLGALRKSRTYFTFASIPIGVTIFIWSTDAIVCHSAWI